LGFDGAGEVFYSAAYREFFENNNLFKNTDQWPGLSFWIHSNATMLTKKLQLKYHNLLKKTGSFSFSVDAGDEETYSKVRVGGSWSQLWDNLDNLYENFLQNTTKHWSFNIIVQDTNFRSIPDLIEKIKKYHSNVPSLGLRRIINWGTFSKEEFLRKAVWMPTHSNYQELVSMLNSIDLKNSKIVNELF
jgi:wyosine [tRNA(Phe)-imidazoG37] synthetase (radical SAM superfamily)